MRILYINYYKESNPKRREEIETCIINNINSRLFYEIINLSDTHLDGVTNFNISHRPTFADFIKATLPIKDAIHIISNLDIYFDETITLADNIGTNELYALSRWDIKNGKPILFNHCDSQDTWIFRERLPVKYGDFTMGVWGCDNRIAHEFKEAGYKVINPAHSIKTYHLHESRSVNSEKKINKTIPPPYHLIYTSQL